MIRLVIFIVLCAFSLTMADLSSGLPKEAVQQKRDNLLFALQIPDTALTDSSIKFLTEDYPDQYALDNYELLQIYLLQRRYHQAIDLLTREFSKADSNVRYSVVQNDSLIRYLDRKMDISDSMFFLSQLRTAYASIADTELKELASTMIDMAPFYKVASKAQILKRKKHSPPDALYEKRYKANLPEYKWVDEDMEGQVIADLDTFETYHPETKFHYFTDAVRKRIGAHLEKYHNWIDPSPKKLYTSSVGFEFLYGLDRSYYVGFPLQYKRWIFTPALGKARKDVEGRVLQTSLGFVFLDSKICKFYPLVGYGPHPYFGGQADFRILTEKGNDMLLGLQGYIALKVRYTAQWVSGDGFNHKLFFGVGGHLW